MVRRHFFICIATYFVLSLQFPLNGKADSRRDFYIQQALEHYYELPRDARSLSLGGSRDVTCQDASCLYLNPAGLARIPGWQATLSLGGFHRRGEEFPAARKIEQESWQGNGIVAVPLLFGTDSASDYGTLALGFSRYQGEVNDRIVSTPDGHTRAIGYGYGGPDFALGYSFVFFDDQLRSDLADLHSHARFLHLVGVQSQVSEDVLLGATLRIGVGQSDTELRGTDKDGLTHVKELSGALGVAREWTGGALSFGLRFSHLESEGNLTDVPQAVVIGGDEEGQRYEVQLGLELEATEAVTFRAGTRWYDVKRYSFEREDLADLTGQVSGMGYSTGLGYSFGISSIVNARLEYGLEYFTPNRGEWRNQVTLTVAETA